MKYSTLRIYVWIVVLAAAVVVWPLGASGEGNRQRAAGPAKSSAGVKSHRKSSRKRSTWRRSRRAEYRWRLANLHLQPDRVTEIQRALGQAGYLAQEPNGKWDDHTRDAMRRYQTDHNFPVTGLPEAKSLMKLGLGPHPLPGEVDPELTARAGSANRPKSGALPSPQATSANKVSPSSNSPRRVIKRADGQDHR